MQLTSPAPDKATRATQRKILDRSRLRAVPPIASTIGIRARRCCLRVAYATRDAQNRATTLTNARALLRNASIASSEVHVITFHPSTACALRVRAIAAAQARSRGFRRTTVLDWPRYCWMTITRRPGCLFQRPRARRALSGTLPPARAQATSERVWT